MSTLMLHLSVHSTIPEVVALASWWTALRCRLDVVRREDGMTTETVIITAGLSALAVAVVAIIVSRVTRRARSIQ
ncbi:MAG TPA: hypothetical protein VM618_05270 [Acidimicrobiia bacterium]|nr:hypothetical protein [Acidimicrobiia bacterium]